MMQQLDLFSSEDSTQPQAPSKVTVIHPRAKGEIQSGLQVRLPVTPAIPAPPLTASVPSVASQPPPVTPGAVTATEPVKKKRGRKSLKDAGDDPGIIKAVDALTLDKQYYSISEVAGMFRVNTSLIRYWENEFDILQPKKNRKGDRLFRQEDIHHLKLIYHLLRERKYTIEGAKQKLKEDRKLAARNFEMVQALLKVKGFLTELKDQL